MSAVLETVRSPVTAARAALEAVRGELGELDARIRAYREELDAIELQQQAHRAATITAVSTGQPLPKALKAKTSEAATALPILQAQRKEIAKREAECQGHVRRCCAQHCETAFKRACIEFAAVPSETNWLNVAGLHAVVTGAGVSAERLALPSSFWGFTIPGMPGVKTIEYLGEHFSGSYALAQGETQRAMHAARKRIEGEVEMALPW